MCRGGEYVRFDPPANFSALINETLNVVETCSGLRIEGTIERRNSLKEKLEKSEITSIVEYTSELKNNQKDILINVLKDTLDFCQERQILFSLHTVFPSSFEIDDTVLPVIISTARVIDEIRDESSCQKE